MAKKELKKEYYLSEVLFSLPGSIYWKNADGVYLGGNRHAARMAGLDSVDQLIGKTDYDLFTKAQADLFRQHDLLVMKTRKNLTWEELSFSPIDEKPFIQLSSKKPLKDDQDNVIGIIGNTIDISELKETQNALAIAKKKAEEASELKSHFMQNMQHDLRTPASGIAAMLEILAKKEKHPKQKKMLAQIADSSRKLLNILNAILEFDSIEYGTFPLLSEEFNLQHVLHDVEALETPTASLKHIHLETHFDKQLPAIVVGDAFRLQRILINLLSNAIKFTPKGYVKTEATLWKKIGKKNILVQIIVKDTGIGIPKEKEGVIFERFTRLDLSSKGVYSGLGLGLSMVKQFVEEMNGSIKVISELHKGTSFICTLPFKLPSSSAKKSQKKQIKRGKITDTTIFEQKQRKILLVEDDNIAQLVATTLLTEEFNCLLDTATTGQKALKFAKTANPLYDLILMDVGLPDGNGCKFAKQIHGISKKMSKIPIVILTARDDDEMHRQCKEYGMQDYLTKPITVEKIKDIFSAWFNNTTDHKTIADENGA